MLIARPTRRFRSKTLDAFDVQRHVIGALLIRELLTRYGRDNIGTLWMLLEPVLLATAVALLHAGNDSGHHGSGIRIVPFALTGYMVFIIFRSIVNRSESAVEANRPLLFHKMVTILDLLVSRALLEVLATSGALALLYGLAVAAGLADFPGRPLRLMAAIVLLAWLSFGLAMCIATGVHFSKAFSKFVHPATYIIMPLSGTFFLLEWIPEPYRTYLSWSPINQIFEMVHSGVFKSYDSHYFNPLYIIAWCMGFTLLGLLLLRILRRHIHLN